MVPSSSPVAVTWSFKLCNKNRSKKHNTHWHLSFALKTNLVSLKTEVDQLDNDRLASVPVDLSKLSDAVKNALQKLCMIN